MLKTRAKSLEISSIITASMELLFTSIEETLEFSRLLGSYLRGGEVFELVGDVGAGKTTFTKGLAEGMGVVDDVQSPSFTVSRVYEARDSVELHHYDFYRLTDPGIMRYDLEESTADERVVVVVEWAQTVSDLLPPERIVVTFSSEDSEVRKVTIQGKVSGVEEAYAAWYQNR